MGWRHPPPPFSSTRVKLWPSRIAIRVACSSPWWRRWGLCSQRMGRCLRVGRTRRGRLCFEMWLLLPLLLPDLQPVACPIGSPGSTRSELAGLRTGLTGKSCSCCSRGPAAPAREPERRNPETRHDAGRFVTIDPIPFKPVCSRRRPCRFSSGEPARFSYLSTVRTPHLKRLRLLQGNRGPG